MSYETVDDNEPTSNDKTVKERVTLTPMAVDPLKKELMTAVNDRRKERAFLCNEMPDLNQGKRQ